MSGKENLIKLEDIQWDCDDPKELKKLPDTVTISELDLPDYVFEEIEQAIDDILTEKYGYCHKGYSWEFTNSQQMPEKEYTYYRWDSMEYTPRQPETQYFKTLQGVTRAVEELKDEFGFATTVHKFTANQEEYNKVKFNPYENTNPIMKPTLNTKVLDWYKNEFSNDDYFDYPTMQKSYKDIQFNNLQGVAKICQGDSIVRNRVIKGLSEASGIRYDRLYDALIGKTGDLDKLQTIINMDNTIAMKEKLQVNTKARKPSQGRVQTLEEAFKTRQKAQQDFAEAMKKSKGR